MIAERTGPRLLARDSLVRVEVRVPRSRAEGMVRYAAMGTAGGALASAAVWGTVTVFADCFPFRIDDDAACLSVGEAALIGAVVGAQTGVVTGAAIGLLFPGERWRSVPVRAGVVLAPGGRAGVGLSVEF